ncbi:MAG: holo-ACP synthase [Pirellulaceae bacterium]
MNVLGIGTDIIEVARIGDMIDKHDELFLRRVYTSQEIEYCSARKAAMQHYAGRWAAKEAGLKALGTGWAKGIRWTDLEVVHLMSGQPELKIHGAAQQVAADLGIREMKITLSHCRAFAVAYVIALGDAS